jgi:DNA polymerase-4
MFIHLHISGFHAAVHQAVDPALRGRPVAVAVDASDQAVVFETSSEARAQRVWPGLRSAAARRRCRDLTIVTPDPGLYRRAQRALLAAASTATPRVAIHQHGLDLDLHGTETMWRPVTGSAHAEVQAQWWAQRLHHEVTTRLQLPTTIGIAARLRVARLAALAARAQATGMQVVAAGDEAAACASWPLRWQREVPPPTLQALADCGITTFGALARLASDDARRLLGAQAEAVLGVLSGEDEPQVPALVDPERTCVVSHRGGAAGLDGEQARRALADLARDLGFALRSAALACTRLTFAGTWLDGRTGERSLRPLRQLRHDDELAAAAQALLLPWSRRVHWQGFSLTAGGLVPIEEQLELLEPPRGRRMQGARDHLRTRFGSELVRPAGSL